MSTYDDVISEYRQKRNLTPDDIVYVMAQGLHLFYEGAQGRPYQSDIYAAKAAYTALSEAGIRVVKQ